MAVKQMKSAGSMPSDIFNENFGCSPGFEEDNESKQQPPYLSQSPILLRIVIFGDPTSL